MPVIVVNGSGRGVGTTMVTVGLAHRLAYAGHDVRVERLAGDTGADRDAAVFTSLEFADAPDAPVAVDALAPGNGVTIIDASDAADAPRLATQLGGVHLHVAVLPGAETAEGSVTLTNHARAAGPLQIPEDRLLAAPTVGSLIAASKARVLARSTEGEQAVCEHIVIGAISHDSDQPYFARCPRKAGVTRAEKVDSALSALRTNAECLILTGGADPSPYLIDRVASGRGTTLLLAPEGTVETVRDIEGTFGHSPFSGEVKVERAGALMATAVNEEALSRLLSPAR